MSRRAGRARLAFRDDPMQPFRYDRTSPEINRLADEGLAVVIISSSLLEVPRPTGRCPLSCRGKVVSESSATLATGGDIKFETIQKAGIEEMTTDRKIEDIIASYERAAQAGPADRSGGAAIAALVESGQSALHLFEAAPKDAPALFYFDACLSYGDVDRLSDALAGYLAHHGVAQGDRVAVILQNVPQFVIASVAAWKIGAIVVSLNPMYRAPELAKLFADCEPGAVICHDDQWAVVEEVARDQVAAPLILWTSAREFQTRDDARILPLPAEAPEDRSLAQALDRELAPPAVPMPGPDEVALILYTSGTTGAPKGAMISHANLVANGVLAREHFEMDGETRVFGVAPLFHITGFELQMIVAFAAGGSMILTNRFSPAVVLDAFLEHRPTFMVGAITAFIALMNQPNATKAHFDSFIHLYSGGAPVAPAVVEAFAERFGRAIRGAYGMTELTSASHLTPNLGAVPVDPQSGALSIGKTIRGVSAVIVDDDNRPLGPGDYGELVVRGPGVTQGYWKKPEETAKALVGGWMHTGDVGFYDEDGWFYLVDRKKDMISASGFKVWPREVEDVIYAFPGVREVAVVGAPDAYRGETVIAFVSAQDNQQIDPTEISQFCRARLAAYKCPTAFHLMDDLPKTETGKIKRNVLKPAS